MPKKHILVIVILGILVLVAGACSRQQSIPPIDNQIDTDEPQYLLFQIFNYDPGLGGKDQPFDKKKTLRVVDEIIDKLGGLKGDGRTRQLGFTVGPLTLDQTDAQLRQLIQESFAIAEEKNVAVAFHIDDSMFWLRRKDLWDDKNNVEWTDWNGTVLPHRFVGWAPTVLAPQMCYESAAIRKEVARIAKDVIAAEVKKGLDDLKAQNKEYLFAGVIAGWETHIADYHYISKENQDAVRLGIKRVRIGYCALTNRGFSASNPPKDFDGELEKVVQDWASFWAQSLNEAGITKGKIYTHLAPIADERYLSPRQISALTGDITDPSFSAIQGHAVPWTAFNDYSRPGFSVYPVFGKTSEGIDSLLVTIHDELKKQGNPHWALSEGSDLSGEMSPETYLASLFNYGASLVNIFGWEIPENAGDMFGANAGKVARSSDSIAAYKKFLNGEKLLIGGSTETNAGGNATPTASGAFDAKIQKIQGNLGKWLAQNPGRQAEINSLIEKMNQYAKDGKQKDAEGVADEILGMIGAE